MDKPNRQAPGADPAPGGPKEETQEEVDARYSWLELVDSGPDPNSPPWTDETEAKFRKLIDDAPPGDDPG